MLGLFPTFLLTSIHPLPKGEWPFHSYFDRICLNGLPQAARPGALHSPDSSFARVFSGPPVSSSILAWKYQRQPNPDPVCLNRSTWRSRIGVRLQSCGSPETNFSHLLWMGSSAHTWNAEAISAAWLSLLPRSTNAWRL